MKYEQYYFFCLGLGDSDDVTIQGILRVNLKKII